MQDIGDGNYAFYAHLKTGSVKVKPGDQLTTGQVIANLGNTGNTDAPHLHFHVMSTPDPLRSNGLPFVFESYKLDGRVASMDALDPLLLGQPARLKPDFTPRDETNDQPAGARRDELCHRLAARACDRSRSHSSPTCRACSCSARSAAQPRRGPDARRRRRDGVAVPGGHRGRVVGGAGMAAPDRRCHRPDSSCGLGTVVVGMLLRKATSQGTAFSFVVVASVVTAILLLGWRAVAAVPTRR